MQGLKRKASRMSSFEPAAKLSKDKTKTSMSSDSPPPGMRRAPTITLGEKSSSSSSSSSKKSLSKTSSVVVGEVVTVPSLPKVASVVEGDDVVTTLTRLASGASIGRTTSFSKAPAAISKELSKTPSLTKTPSLLAKSISRGGSIVLETDDVPSLSRSSSKAKSSVKSLTPVTSEVGVSLEKVVSLTKSLSKPSMTMRESAMLVAAAVEEAEEEVAEAEAEAEKEVEEEDEPEGEVGVPLPPGGLMEIVFSFDTTGSMYSCLDQVRNRIQDMVQRLQADIPGIRIAIFAHGDYVDKSNYIVQWIDFGSTTPEICKFVKEVGRTSGGDYPEAYEMVLRRCQTVLSWTPGSQRSLVMIGDAIPHEADDPQNDENIDWKTECKALAASGVRIYGVQASNNDRSADFFKTMAAITRGRHLQLDQFSNMFDIIMAICYRERGDEFLEAYEEEVRGRYGGAHMGKDLEGLFGTLKDDSDPAVPTFKTPKAGRKGASKVKAVKKLKEVVAAKGAAKKLKGVGKKKKTTATKKKASKKVKEKKIRRENITDARFSQGNKKIPLDSSKLDSLTWTSWQRGMFKETSTKGGTTRRRAGGNPGYVKTNLFKKNNNVRAIYELGVRAPDTLRKRVFAMMIKHTKGFKDGMRWDRCLLGGNLAKQEANSVITRGGEIYVRRAVLESKADKSFADVVKYVNDHYSYAWNCQPHRGVLKDGNFLMSGSSKTAAKPTKKKSPAKKAEKRPAPLKKKAAKKTKLAAKKKPKAAKPAKKNKKAAKPAKKNAKAKKAKPAAKKGKGKAKAAKNSPLTRKGLR